MRPHAGHRDSRGRCSGGLQRLTQEPCLAAEPPGRSGLFEAVPLAPQERSCRPPPVLTGLWVPTLQPEPSRPRPRVSVTIEDPGSPKGQVEGREPPGNLSSCPGVGGQGRASVRWGRHQRTFAPAQNTCCLISGRRRRPGVPAHRSRLSPSAVPSAALATAPEPRRAPPSLGGSWKTPTAPRGEGGPSTGRPHPGHRPGMLAARAAWIGTSGCSRRPTRCPMRWAPRAEARFKTPREVPSRGRGLLAATPPPGEGTWYQALVPPQGGGDGQCRRPGRQGRGRPDQSDAGRRSRPLTPGGQRRRPPSLLPPAISPQGTLHTEAAQLQVHTQRGGRASAWGPSACTPPARLPRDRGTVPQPLPPPSCFKGEDMLEIDFAVGNGIIKLAVSVFIIVIMKREEGAPAA